MGKVLIFAQFKHRIVPSAQSYYFVMNSVFQSIYTGEITHIKKRKKNRSKFFLVIIKRFHPDRHFGTHLP